MNKIGRTSASLAGVTTVLLAGTGIAGPFRIRRRNPGLHGQMAAEAHAVRRRTPAR
jgi:hypothetical protein